jgi:hypothetical protein
VVGLTNRNLDQKPLAELIKSRRSWLIRSVVSSLTSNGVLTADRYARILIKLAENFTVICAVDTGF